MTEPTVLPELLDRAAETTQGVRFLQGGERESHLDYATLRRHALGLLGHWQRQGIRPGEAVVLYVQDNRAFLAAFWACQLGGLIAVPLSAGLQALSLAKLARVATALDTPWLFSERRLWMRFRQAHDGLALFEHRVCLLDAVPSDSAAGSPVPSRADAVTLIQYSSGATGDPKGVQLSHANLIANVRAIVEAAAIEAGDSTFSWMPLSHDMGLIGFHLVPTYAGLDQVLMDSDLFIRRPALWLQRAAALRATLLCSPTFGCRHYLQRVKTADTLMRLDAVRLIFNGAEPVSASVCRAFLERLAPCGLRPESMYPVYGLAEASLAVCFPRPGSGLTVHRLAADSLAPGDTVRPATGGARSVELVALGSPVRGCEVRIAADDGREIAKGRVGRVQIRGIAVTRGYYGRPNEDGGAWLDTGDLGFIGAEGLVICGRAKEVIFAAGQNLYPQDIEAVLEEAGCVPAGKVAVTALRSDDDAADHLLVFVQHRGGADVFAPVAQSVRAALATNAGLEAHAVIAVPRLPRTSSGKLQRFRLAESYARGDFPGPGPDREEPASEGNSATAQRLLELCRQHFPGYALGLDHNLLELGADSLKLVSLHEDIERLFPGRVAVTDLFEHPSIRELTAYIDR